MAIAHTYAKLVVITLFTKSCLDIVAVLPNEFLNLAVGHSNKEHGKTTKV